MLINHPVSKRAPFKKRLCVGTFNRRLCVGTLMVPRRALMARMREIVGVICVILRDGPSPGDDPQYGPSTGALRPFVRPQ